MPTSYDFDRRAGCSRQLGLSISDVSSCRSLENAHHHRAEYIAEPGSQAANAALNVVKVPPSKLTGASWSRRHR